MKLYDIMLVHLKKFVGLTTYLPQNTNLRRYSASKIMGSRIWPFGVTWRDDVSCTVDAVGEMMLSAPLFAMW